MSFRRRSIPPKSERMPRSRWRDPHYPAFLGEGNRLSVYSAAALRFSGRFGLAEAFLPGVWIAFWTSVMNSARVTGRIFLRVSSRGASSLCPDSMGRVYHGGTRFSCSLSARITK